MNTENQKHLSDDPLVADLQKALELDRVLEKFR